MPKLVSEDGDVLLFDFAGESAGAMFGPVPQVLFCRVQMSLVGVLKRLSRAFVSGQVIFFSVVLSAGSMGVGGKVMVLSSYLL
ncbi:MAG: hypothetical protein ABSF98_04950 [Bryobacteraceae bacterium]